MLSVVVVSRDGCVPNCVPACYDVFRSVGRHDTCLTLSFSSRWSLCDKCGYFRSVVVFQITYLNSQNSACSYGKGGSVVEIRHL